MFCWLRPRPSEQSREGAVMRLGELPAKRNAIADYYRFSRGQHLLSCRYTE
jgi:hypothetical protein